MSSIIQNHVENYGGYALSIIFLFLFFLNIFLVRNPLFEMTFVHSNLDLNLEFQKGFFETLQENAESSIIIAVIGTLIISLMIIGVQEMIFKSPAKRKLEQAVALAIALEQEKHKLELEKYKEEIERIKKKYNPNRYPIL